MLGASVALVRVRGIRLVWLGSLGLSLLVGCARTTTGVGGQEMRPVSEFQIIRVGGLVHVVVHAGVEEAISIRASGISLRDVVTRVDDGLLLVTTRGQHNSESVHIDVTYRRLTEIHTSGSATITSAGPIRTDTLEVFLDEAGDARLEVDVDHLHIDMRGAGNLYVTGRTKTQRVVSHGSAGSLNNVSLQVGR